MSSQTTNLHLVKPAAGETADIDVINGNMDTIDSAVGTLRESVSLLKTVNLATGKTATVKPSGAYTPYLIIAQRLGAYLVYQTNTSGGIGTYVIHEDSAGMLTFAGVTNGITITNTLAYPLAFVILSTQSFTVSVA